MNGDFIGSVNQSTIDSLNAFLQETMATVHSLAMKHNNLAFNKIDSHNSAHGNPSCDQFTDIGVLNGFKNGLKPLNPPCPERFRYMRHDLMVPPHGCDRVTPPNSSEDRNGFTHEDVFSAQRSGMAATNPFNYVDSKQGGNYCYFENEYQKHSWDGFQECQSFIEEIKKTAQVWSLKHKSLDRACRLVREQPCLLLKGKGDTIASQSGITSVCGVDQPEDAHLQSSSQVHQKEGAAKAFDPAEGPSYSTAFSQQMPEALAGDARCGTLSFFKGPEAFESVRGVLFEKSNCTEKIVSGTTIDNSQSSLPERYQVGSTSDDKSTELPSSSDCVGPIVESPDWLPHGWVTELKTRTSGRSAGCKYKCYFDPVSKRRFRTQKEVFCFLTTGMTGRYKPKFKGQQCGDSPRNESFLKRALPNCFSSGNKRAYQTGLFPYYSTYNSSEGSVKLSAPVLQTLLKGHTPSDGKDSNSTTHNVTSGHLGCHSEAGMVDIQAAALQLLAQDDNMTLDARARLYATFSPRPRDLCGIRTPGRDCKRTNPRGKKRLEALGKVICQQSLSKLRGCGDKGMKS